MVLINGVKYACERCIRGHRVTTCTHTDQPLTMIKPKGRPASQCQHCRDQRKSKSLHVSCTCGKKGKSPGMHLASCLCNKSSHCTCSTNSAKKIPKARKKLSKSMSDLNVHHLSPESSSSLPDTVGMPSTNGNFMIDDVLIPFETGNGLLDLFSSTVDRSASGGNSNSESTSPSDSSNGVGVSAKKREKSLDLVDNMFPLFPLIGSCSFDDSKSQPLSSFPIAEEGNNVQNMKFDTMQGSLSNGLKNQPQNITTHQPHAIMPNISSHYQPIRPKRPESVLSMTSTSSTATNVSKNSEGKQNGSQPSVYTSASVIPHNGSINSHENLKNLNNPESDILGNAFMEHHDSQLNEYSKLIKHYNGQGLSMEGIPTQNPQGQWNGMESTSMKFTQEPVNSGHSTEFDIPLFNEFIPPATYDTKNDMQF